MIFFLIHIHVLFYCKINKNKKKLNSILYIVLLLLLLFCFEKLIQIKQLENIILQALYKIKMKIKKMV